MRKNTVKIEVKIIKENKDGSANAQVDFDKKGLEVLVQWGLVSLLTKGINEYAVRPEEIEVVMQPVKTYTGDKTNSVKKGKK